MGKIVGYTEVSSLGGITSQVERKTLNSIPEECCLGESVAY